MNKNFYNTVWFWTIVIPMLFGILAGFFGKLEIVPWLFGFATMSGFVLSLKWWFKVIGTGNYD